MRSILLLRCRKRVEVVVIQRIELIHVEVSLQNPLLEVVRLLAGSGLSWHLAYRCFHGGDTLGARVVLRSKRQADAASTGRSSNGGCPLGARA